MNSNLYNLLNSIAKDESYLDIKVIMENREFKTSKLFIYCKYPYLLTCLESSDLLIVDGYESPSLENICNNSAMSPSGEEKVSVAKLEILLSNSDDTLQVCNYCGKTFLDSKKLSWHTSDCHSKNVTCSLCGKSFSKTSNLTRHMVTHNNNFLQCTICQTKLKSEQSLKRHMLIHASNKSTIQCKICGKEFIHKYHLTAHELIHNNVKFPCAKCGKMFTYKHNLNRHRCKIE